MFNLLKIDYDRSEQMLSLLNINTLVYVLINLLFLAIAIILKIFINTKEEDKIKFNTLCGDTNYRNKDLSWETFFLSFLFYCNFVMIICIKLQRKVIFKQDGYFVSRNFYVSEIIDQNSLLSQITNEETYKISKVSFIKYICKVLICLAISLFLYIIFELLEYLRDYNYILFSIIASSFPFNLLEVFLFLFSKILFPRLGLEINNDSEEWGKI